MLGVGVVAGSVSPEVFVFIDANQELIRSNLFKEQLYDMTQKNKKEMRLPGSFISEDFKIHGQGLANAGRESNLNSLINFS